MHVRRRSEGKQGPQQVVRIFAGRFSLLQQYYTTPPPLAALLQTPPPHAAVSEHGLAECYGSNAAVFLSRRCLIKLFRPKNSKVRGPGQRGGSKTKIVQSVKINRVAGITARAALYLPPHTTRSASKARAHSRKQPVVTTLFSHEKTLRAATCRHGTPTTPPPPTCLVTHDKTGMDVHRMIRYRQRNQ